MARKFKLFRFCNVVFWQANVAYWKNVVFGSIGKVRILAGRPTPANITMNKIIICIDNELWTMEEEEDLLRIIIVQQWKCKSFFLYLPFRYWNLMHFSYFKDSIDKTEFGEKWRCDQAGSFWMRESNYARGGWRSTHAQIVNDF